MSAVRFDDSGWPIAIVTFEGEASPADLDAYLATLERWIARSDAERIRYGAVVDATLATGLGASQRKRMGEWMKAHAADTQRACAGIAFVISSNVVRGLLTAIFWIAPMPTDHTIVATRDEALRWMKARVAQRARAVTASR